MFLGDPFPEVLPIQMKLLNMIRKIFNGVVMISEWYVGINNCLKKKKKFIVA